MNKLRLATIISLVILGMVHSKPASACSPYWPEGNPPPQPRLEGWITYPEATGFANSNETDYFGIQLKQATSCGGGKIYFHKNFVYASVPILVVLILVTVVALFRKKS